ncbi:MAG: hypothetical protein CMO34_01545 [Verrucomicrobia bacterium]|nr:hypothetical protein [Verrucomicrobiota bacterium]
MKHKNKNLFYFIFILMSLFLVEFALRFCFPLPELSNFNRINYQILDRQDDRKGYLRNIQMLWKSTLDTNHAFVHQLNTYGFRDNKDWEVKRNRKKRFFFVGDSFVEGMMSPKNQSIPLGFKKALGEAQDNYELFNCGMMGIGLNEYIKFLKDAVPIFRPDAVFLVMYSNDAPFQRKYIPQNRILPEYYSSFHPRLLTLMEHIKKEDPIPFRFSTEVRPFYKAVPDHGNPWTFKEATLSKEVTPTIAAAMKKGDFNYFRTNWILEEEKFLKTDINLFEKFGFLKEYLLTYNAELNVVYIPSRSQVSTHYYQFEKQACLLKCPDALDLTVPIYQKHAAIIAADCKRLEIPFLDLTTFIKSKEEGGKHMYWNYDDHMRGSSYMQLGREIQQFWWRNSMN